MRKDHRLSKPVKFVFHSLGIVFIFPILLAFFHPFLVKEKGENRQKQQTLQVNVLADRDWTDTGLDVIEGQQIYFTATGGISLQRGNPMAYCDPDGYNLKTVQQPIPDRNIGALIGKVVHLISVEIDEETGEEVRKEMIEVFYIGSSRRVEMPVDGRLFLGINENIVGDNSGQYRVTLFLMGEGVRFFSLDL